MKSSVAEGDGFFREIYNEIGEKYPGIEKNYVRIDTWAYLALVHPEYYDVVVMPNQYGDILSDMCGGIQGSIGLASSICIGDEHAYAEAAHGSAPDIAGKNIANPISVILSVSMLLDWMGEKHADTDLKAAGRGIDWAVNAVLEEKKVRTRDIGGTSSTQQVGEAIAEKVREALEKHDLT